jgi:hypothetical protein
VARPLSDEGHMTASLAAAVRCERLHRADDRVAHFCEFTTSAARQFNRRVSARASSYCGRSSP